MTLMLNKHSHLLLVAMLIVSTCSAAQSPATGLADGYGYVDLGLSVKWATCNVGANQPSDFGDYFAWGEMQPKQSYTKSNSTNYDRAEVDFYDAAAASRGSQWRMPTEAEMSELINNCKWQWTTVGGFQGYMVTGKKTGNSIFLPAAGYREAEKRTYLGTQCLYATRSTGTDDRQYARTLLANEQSATLINIFRYCGMSIRPVVNNAAH